MSQITRCPSCATTFKVVADQLRISEGWVRCGQCKEVFDASAHLLPVVSAALLPDVSLADLRTPAAPVARKQDALGAWGGGRAPAVAGDMAQTNGPMGRRAPSPATETVASTAVAAASHGGGTQVPAAPVLDIPSPAVPAFLTAGAHADTSTDALGEEAATPFTWRAHSAPRAVFEVDAAAFSSATGPEDEAVSGPSMAVGSGGLASGQGRGDPVRDPLEPDSSSSSPSGYELPFAELRDSDGPLGASIDADAADAASPPADFLPPPASQGEAQRTVIEPAPVPPAPALPSVDFVPKADSLESPAMELVQDDSHAAVLQVRHKKSVDDDDEADTPASDPEVSFVVAARRKAFWRKPVVRMVLGLVFVVSLLGLALQIAVQERDHVAALDVRSRPWLVKLCEPLRCELAPVRQIADVVIDSSSFNKARGDSYQLALTMKSTATIPLAMPAVELTLTDAQDQPVLRRVLLPTDMAAPAELPAKGEWGTSVSVLVTTGGARVAGYRLLAFYP